VSSEAASRPAFHLNPLRSAFHTLRCVERWNAICGTRRGTRRNTAERGRNARNAAAKKSAERGRNATPVRYASAERYFLP
jgi:hypothetical protein